MARAVRAVLALMAPVVRVAVDLVALVPVGRVVVGLAARVPRRAGGS